MKHFGNQLDELFRKRKITQKEFAAQIGKSEQTVSKWKNKDSIKADVLETISKALNVPITYWFDDVYIENSSMSAVISGNGNASSIYGDATIIVDKDKEIEHLRELLAEKERTIQVLIKNISK